MMKQPLKNLFERITCIGVDPNDGNALRLQKSLWGLYASPFLVAGVAWGGIYVLFHEPLADSILNILPKEIAAILSWLATRSGAPYDRR
ncbi:MAG: hypothetical protein Fur0022_17180 [Anaerolineales bacterium]